MRQPPEPLDAGTISRLRVHLAERLVLPGDSGYAARTRLWNAAIRRQPCAVAACHDAEDVIHALAIARDAGRAATVRSGGHGVAGRAVADGAILIDVSALRTVDVDAKAGIATAGGGATWHDLDLATCAVQRATTGGLVSSTGVAGLTMGGGTGWLMRRHGLAADNLASASLVTGDGRFLRASEEENPELFWALRGGGGGLGVITQMQFRLHPVATVLAGLVVRPAAEAAATLRLFRDCAADAPDPFCGMCVLAHAPPLPFLDPAWHRRPVCLMALCWCAEPAAGEKFLEPLRRSGTPLADHVGPMPYVVWQHLQDGAAPPARHQYWKSASYTRLTDAVIEQLADVLVRLPTPETEIHVQHLGGAVARVGSAATAFAQRDAGYFVNLIGATPWPEQYPGLVAGIRGFWQQLAPQALAGSLPNFLGDDDASPADQLGPERSARISALRQRLDPSGTLARA